MKIKYNYASPSMCSRNSSNTILGLSTDLSRDEKVSFLGKLKHPLIFRDAMLMLREIVISDTTQKKKERVEFFQWLEGEIERRILTHKEYMPQVRDELKESMNNLVMDIKKQDEKIQDLHEIRKGILEVYKRQRP
ncbi:hypothetical protein SAMN04487886_11395 [Clostridium sp. DSM 8431]|uniref:hypothetical protein n=1 Tax=Clostridium sp. DSM 8431 TaxID=1761781 RepID=UPI0008F31BE7|nr:hypothetical protein [Clostridium sp. DSM 8431]SFU75846.1 hypothetical protein SAMN04487886_11395 [Clostridium sp. DSM 8431]